MTRGQLAKLRQAKKHELAHWDEPMADGQRKKPPEKSYEKNILEVTGEPDGRAVRQLIVQGYIGHLRLRFLLDTGASLSFAREDIIEKLKPTPKLYESEVDIILGDNAQAT